MKTPALIALACVGLALAAVYPGERCPDRVAWLVPVFFPDEIAGPVTHVRDGDTIEVGGRPIRFGSLDCAELATAEGRQARAEMRKLVEGKTLICRLNGDRSYDRWIGSCSLPNGDDLAGVMIAQGTCRRFW